PPCGIRVAPSIERRFANNARPADVNEFPEEPGGRNEEQVPRRARGPATGLRARSRLLRGRCPRADARTAGAAGPAGRNAAARPGRDGQGRRAATDYTRDAVAGSATGPERDD